MRTKFEESKSNDKSKLTLMSKFFAKYCLLVNQVELAQLLDAKVIESSAKWATNEVLGSLTDFV
jgi:hypothetical protein